MHLHLHIHRHIHIDIDRGIYRYVLVSVLNTFTLHHVHWYMWIVCMHDVKIHDLHMTYMLTFALSRI